MIIHYRNIQSDDDWNWIKTRANPILTEGTTGIIAVDTEVNEIVAMAAFDNWTENSVQMHMAIDRPTILRHGFLEEIGNYVYNTCEKGIILATVPANNPKAVKLDTHIGMDVVYRVKDGFKKGVDYLLLELRKENCRWIKQEGGV